MILCIGEGGRGEASTAPAPKSKEPMKYLYIGQELPPKTSQNCHKNTSHLVIQTNLCCSHSLTLPKSAIFKSQAVKMTYQH